MQTRPRLTETQLDVLRRIRDTWFADLEIQVTLAPIYRATASALVRKGLARHCASLTGGAYDLTREGAAVLAREAA